jgi:signal transduction histidine kinase
VRALPPTRSSPATWVRARWDTFLTVRSDDAETARLGRLFVLLMGVAVGIVACLTAVFAAMGHLGYAGPFETRLSLAFPLPFLPFSALCIVLAKRGRVRLAIHLYVWANLFAISGAVLVFEGIHSPAWLLYAYTITIAGTLLRPGHALGLTGLVVAFFLALLGLGELGLYAPLVTFPPATLDFIESWLRLVMLASTVGFLTFLNMRSLNQARADVLRHSAERLRAEEEVARARRLDALGRLASGVAHDFNNLVAVINASSDCALDVLPPDHPAAADLAEIRSAGGKAGKLVKQLLTFGKEGVARPERTSLDVCVRGLEGLLRRSVGPRIRLTVRSAPEPRDLLADPVQLEQVVLNLALNGRDAMADGGDLAFEVENRDAGPDGAPGPWAVLSVRDTGCGMSAEVRDRIFEPFFTTKGEGLGTGLGLSVSYGIIQAHGGTIDVHSDVGEGTTVTIALPIVAPPDAPLADDVPVRVFADRRHDT